MGFASLLRKGMSLAKSAGKIPGVGMIPGIGNVLSAVGTAATVYQGAKALGFMSGGGGGGGAGNSLPMLPGMSGGPRGMITPGQTGGIGIPRGPGGGMQLPWHDPAIPEYLKQFALDDSYLKISTRAPKGYVVVKDASGRPFAVLKSMAKAFHLWKPKPKPPISVRDWHHLQGAARVAKKLKAIEKTAHHIARLAGPRHHHAAPVGHKKGK